MEQHRKTQPRIQAHRGSGRDRRVAERRGARLSVPVDRRSGRDRRVSDRRDNGEMD